MTFGDEHFDPGVESIDALDQLGLFASPAVIGPHPGSDVGQIARPGRRDDGLAGARRLGGARWKAPGALRQAEGGEPGGEFLVERGDTIVVETAGHSAENRELLRRDIEELPVSGDLAADVAHRVFATTTVELVDCHDVGEVEHVDLLQLRSSAELGGHHIERDVGHLGDRRVALADPRCLDDHQIKARGLTDLDHRRHTLG